MAIEIQQIMIIIMCITIIAIFIYGYTYKKNKTNQDLVMIEKKTILDILKHNSKKKSEVPAFKIRNGKKWKTITYIEYYKNVINFAQSINYWLGNSVNVGIMGFNSPGWMFAHLGCMQNGGISVPLDRHMSIKKCGEIIDDADIEILVVDNDEQLIKIANDKKIKKIINDRIKLIIYYSPISKKIIDEFTQPILSMGVFMSKTNSHLKSPKINTVAQLQYNKTIDGSIISHKNIMASVTKFINACSIENQNYNVVSYLPLDNMTIQITDMYAPILSCGTIWFADESSVKKLEEGVGKNKKQPILEIIKQAKPSIFIGNVNVWKNLKTYIDDNCKLIDMIAFWKKIETIGLDKCKLTFNISKNMPVDLKVFFRSNGLEISELYGCSEATGIISISAPGMASDSVGIPIMNIKMGKKNEIMIKGVNLFGGYYKNKNKTLKTFTKDGWFKVNDKGLLNNNLLYLQKNDT